jgi:hygromycin-B 7''-O-kinase
MNNATLNALLSIRSETEYEQYEKFKLQKDLIEDLAREILLKHQLPEAEFSLFSEGTNLVFDYAGYKVIKIYPPFHLEQFQSEVLVLKSLGGKLSVETPVIEYHGEIEGWPYLIMTKLGGTLLESLWDKLDHHNKTILIQEIGELIREVHSLPTTGLESIDCHWKQFISRQIEHCVQRHREKNLPDVLLQQIPDYISSIRESLLQIEKPVILTGEYTPMNFLVKQENDIWHISGLIDFGDAMLGHPEYDLLGPIAFLIQGDKSLLKVFLKSYGYSNEQITAALSHKLMSLLLLHRYSNLDIQIRIEDWKKKVHKMKDLENLILGF